MIIISGLIFPICLFGQKNENPFLSDLEGKRSIKEVMLSSFRIPYGSENIVLNDTCSYKFDSEGRIILSVLGYISFPSVLIDSLVYDSKGNLIESYRFRPDRKTLESKYLMVYDLNKNLIKKLLFDEEESVLSTDTLTKQTSDYKKYTKTYKGGYVRTSEYYYNPEGLKTKLIVSDKDSIILNEIYEYGSNDKYAKIKNLNSKGVIVSITTFEYDSKGNLLIEFKKNIQTGEIEYKYVYTYDTFGNRLTEKNSFPNGNVHEFKFEYLYDSKGNWIKQTVYRSGKKSDIYERQIKYK